MSLPIYNARFALLLVCGLVWGCSSDSPEPEGDLIECAIGVGADYTRVCVVERIGADQIIIHGPNGGFRRFALVSEDESVPLAVLDGSANIAVIQSGDRSTPLEFSVESDVYRLDLSILNADANE